METIAPSPVLCKVFFDRSARQYIVRNGCEVARFPHGPENKVKAQWAAIDHDRPDVYAVARELLAGGGDEGRLIRAARLVTLGKVTESTFDHGLARAQVEASEGNRSPVTGWPHYLVTHNLVWSCDCHDYQSRSEASDRRPCKHICAVMIVQQLMNRESAQMSRADEPDRATALPASVDERGSIEDMLGYDDEPTKKPWYLRADPMNRKRDTRWQFQHNYGR